MLRIRRSTCVVLSFQRPACVDGQPALTSCSVNVPRPSSLVECVVSLPPRNGCSDPRQARPAVPSRAVSKPAVDSPLPTDFNRPPFFIGKLSGVYLDLLWFRAPCMLFPSGGSKADFEIPRLLFPSLSTPCSVAFGTRCPPLLCRPTAGSLPRRSHRRR